MIVDALSNAANLVSLRGTGAKLDGECSTPPPFPWPGAAEPRCGLEGCWEVHTPGLLQTKLTKQYFGSFAITAISVLLTDTICLKNIANAIMLLITIPLCHQISVPGNNVKIVQPAQLSYKI